MRELLLRILKRSILVALALGVMGYIFAEISLVMMRMNPGIEGADNNSVRWRAPLTMAGLGVGLLVIMEVLFYAVRGKRTPAPARTAETRAAPPAAEKKSSSEPIDS